MTVDEIQRQAVHVPTESVLYTELIAENKMLEHNYSELEVLI